MNIKTGLLGATVTGAFLLMASCGGSSDSNNNTGGSASGGSTSAGSSSAGTSNSSAGKSSNTGGTANNTGGTRNNNGGAQAFGGFMFGGNLSFGGGGFDPSDFVCGDPKPEAGADCAAGSQPCLDGSNVCYCQAEKWACIDLLAAGQGGAGPNSIGQIECPAEQPMSGEACEGLGACQYGPMQGCACFGGSWMCN
ncbi:MAG TPA: hypothetical protein VHB79_33085 [Polyangiaceae bacterium]|nr:hypothetical protein [Polyangiaceae bacterium]